MLTAVSGMVDGNHAVETLGPENPQVAGKIQVASFEVGQGSPGRRGRTEPVVRLNLDDVRPKLLGGVLRGFTLERRLDRHPQVGAIDELEQTKRRRARIGQAGWLVNDLMRLEGKFDPKRTTKIADSLETIDRPAPLLVGRLDAAGPPGVGPNPLRAEGPRVLDETLGLAKRRIVGFGTCREIKIGAYLDDLQTSSRAGFFDPAQVGLVEILLPELDPVVAKLATQADAPLGQLLREPKAHHAERYFQGGLQGVRDFGIIAGFTGGSHASPSRTAFPRLQSPHFRFRTDRARCRWLLVYRETALDGRPPPLQRYSQQSDRALAGVTRRTGGANLSLSQQADQRPDTRSGETTTGV